MMSYETYINLIQQLDQLVGIFEQHPDETTREQATALLTGLDALHREGMQRLVERVRQAGGDSILEEATIDPVVETLLGLYDLAELNLPAESDLAGTASFIRLDDIAVRANRSSSTTCDSGPRG